MSPDLFEPPRFGPLEPPDRLLMGPGPSDVHPRVLKAMSTTLIGHLDPAFVQMMNEVQELLRYTLRTKNRWTIPVSGTGSAAMEAAFANLVEPGNVGSRLPGRSLPVFPAPIPRLRTYCRLLSADDGRKPGCLFAFH